MGADDEDDDDALTWVDHLGDQPGFAFLREPARTQERPRRHCISPRSALARSQARTYVYVRSRNERHKRTHAPTHAHVQSLNAALGSSVEATNTLQRINRITAPPSIRSPPFCHDDMYVCIARVSLRNNATSRCLSWTATASQHHPPRELPRKKQENVPRSM